MKTILESGRQLTSSLVCNPHHFHTQHLFNLLLEGCCWPLREEHPDMIGSAINLLGEGGIRLMFRGFCLYDDLIFRVHHLQSIALYGFAYWFA